MIKKINEKLESKKLSESSNRDKFLDWHENADNYNKYPEKFDKVYKILDKYGTENDPVDELFDKASDEDRSAIMGIISESCLEESANGRQVWTMVMDVEIPNGFNKSDLNYQGKVYKAVSDALDSVGCAMAGDYISAEYEQTEIYDDNGYFDESLKESYGEGLNTSDLSRIRDKIDELIELMDDEEVESIKPSPNTYRIGVPFIGTYEGYVDLQDPYQYVGHDEDEDY